MSILVIFLPYRKLFTILRCCVRRNLVVGCVLGFVEMFCAGDGSAGSEVTVVVIGIHLLQNRNELV